MIGLFNLVTVVVLLLILTEELGSAFGVVTLVGTLLVVDSINYTVGRSML